MVTVSGWGSGELMSGWVWPLTLQGWSVSPLYTPTAAWHPDLGKTEMQVLSLSSVVVSALCGRECRAVCQGWVSDSPGALGAWAGSQAGRRCKGTCRFLPERHSWFILDLFGMWRRQLISASGTLWWMDRYPQGMAGGGAQQGLSTGRHQLTWDQAALCALVWFCYPGANVAILTSFSMHWY